MTHIVNYLVLNYGHINEQMFKIDVPKICNSANWGV